jgi:hypothetical protein
MKIQVEKRPLYFMKRVFFIISLVALVLFLTVGCATIMNGSSEQLSVNSNETGATVEVNGKIVGTTPFMGKVAKTGGGARVVVSKPGFVTGTQVVSMKQNAFQIWAGNALLGGLFGGPLSTTTDYVSKGAYSFSPNSCYVQLTPTSGGAQPTQPTPPVATRPTTPAPTGTEGLPNAIEKGVYSATQDIRERSRVAVMQVTAPDRGMRDFITGEIEIFLRNNNYRVIDRSQLDRIREEQKLQMSGEVDDATLVSLGKFAGADYLVMVKVDGEGSFRRLRIRVLETQTAEVAGASAEPF